MLAVFAAEISRVLFRCIPFTIQPRIAEIENYISQDHEKIDEVKHGCQVVSVCDDFSENTKYISDFDQAQERKAFPFCRP